MTPLEDHMTPLTPSSGILDDPELPPERPVLPPEPDEPAIVQDDDDDEPEDEPEP